MKEDKIGEAIKNLEKDIVLLADEYNEYLPPYEFACVLIRMMTDLCFTCAPNDKVAIKTIMASIQMGIEGVEERDN